MTAATDSNDLYLATGEALDVGLPVAGIGSRSYAFIIDWHIRVLAALAWSALIWLLAMLGDRLALPWDGGWSVTWAWLAFLPAGLIYLGYHPVLEIAMHGRTYGKRMAGVRLVDRSGQPPGIGALLIRNLFRLLDSLPTFYALGLTIAAFHPRQLRLGDIAAGTVLVYEQKVDARQLARAAALVSQEGLEIRHQELVLDLLERWQELAPDVREHFARRLLEMLGRPQPGGADEAALQRALEALVA